MHICVLIDNLRMDRLAGAETSALLLCRELAHRGHTVSIITAGPFPIPPEKRMWEGLRIYQITSNPPGLLADYATISRPRIVKQVMALFKKLRPDLIQTHVIHNFMSYRTLSSIKNAFPCTPIAVTLHDHSALCRGALRCKGRRLANMKKEDFFLPSLLECWACQKHTFNPFKRRALLKILNHSCDIVIFVSKALQSFYLVNGLSNRSTVIYNGTILVDNSLFGSCEKSFREKHGLLDRRLVVCGGRMKTLKGFHTVIEALPALINNVGKNIALVCYGDENAYSRGLELRARQLGVLDQYRFLGWMPRPELEHLLSISEIGVVPSIGADALPRAVYEYMAMGLITVATRVGGAKEIIRDGRNGFLFNPWNSGELAYKLSCALAHDKINLKIKAAARSTIESQFLVSHAAEKRIHFYKNLLNRCLST